MSEGAKKTNVIRDAPVEEPHGIDVTLIRRLLAMTPAERFRSAVSDAHGLARFDEAIRRGPR